MKSVISLAFSIVAFIVGVAVILANLHALTTTILAFSGACFAFSWGTALPTNFDHVVMVIGPYLPLAGGRRRDDPPAPGATP